MSTMHDTRTEQPLPVQPPDPQRALFRTLGMCTALLIAATLALVFLVPDEQPAVVMPAPPSTTASPAVDLVAEVRRLEAADHYLRLHPDPAQVGQVYDRENPVYQEAVTYQRRLASGELRYDPLPQPWPIRDVQVVSRTPDTARVVVSFDGRPHYRVVDRAGQVVEERPAGGPTQAVWTLRLRDGQWRILASEVL